MIAIYLEVYNNFKVLSMRSSFLISNFSPLNIIIFKEKGNYVWFFDANELHYVEITKEEKLKQRFYLKHKKICIDEER